MIGVLSQHVGHRKNCVAFPIEQALQLASTSHRASNRA